MLNRWADLRKATTRELVTEYDRIHEDFFHPDDEYRSRQAIRDELHHREIAGFTKAMAWMTAVITVATILNVILWAVN